MEKTDQELYDIADQMLANLEKEYWEVQQQNINFDKQCPENNQNLHEDYQLLDGDDYNNQLEESDEEEEPNQDVGDHVNQQEEVTNNIKQVEQINLKQQDELDAELNNGIGELMEVFPMPQWVPEEKEVNINSEKIKEFTLKMNLPVPEWVNNEDSLKTRIMELFGKK